MTDRPNHRAAAERMLADADEWTAQAEEPTPEAGELSCLAYAVVHALLAIHDTLTAPDRYFANEARQREEAEPDTPSGRAFTARDKDATDAVQAKINALGEWLAVTVKALTPEPDPLDEDDHRDRLDRDGDVVRRKGNKRWAWPDYVGFDAAAGSPLAALDASDGPLTFAPEPAPEPGPLDENDHRDRLTSDRRRIVRHGRGHWHTPAIYGKWCDADCTEMSLRDWARAYGPLAFAPDADGAPSVTAPAADNPADDAVDGEEGERRYLNAQTGPRDAEAERGGRRG